MTDRYSSVHPHRPGTEDLRPTAKQVIYDCDALGKLENQVILITGATSGLGLASARAMLSTGATLFLTARDEQKAKELQNKFQTSSKVHVLVMDLLSLASVRRCADEFLQSGHPLNILLCNAGVMACPLAYSSDGIESQFATNFLAHYCLFKSLFPALKAVLPRFGHNARVVVVSSAGHKISPVDLHDINFERSSYNEWSSYGRSKTAMIYLANYIDRTYSKQGIRANSLHPGSIFTPLQRHQPSMSSGASQYQTPEMQALLKTEEQGAATSVWAMVEPDLEVVGGRYLEDVQIAKLATEKTPRSPGYASWAFNETAECDLMQYADRLLAKSGVVKTSPQ